MARGIYTGPFIEDVAGLPAQVASEIQAKCLAAEEFPGVGSALVEPSLRRAYGGTCLKLLIAGYEVLYECIDPEGVVIFLGVVPQRRVR